MSPIFQEGYARTTLAAVPGALQALSTSGGGEDKKNHIWVHKKSKKGQAGRKDNVLINLCPTKQLALPSL